MAEINLHPEYPQKAQLDSAEAWLDYADALLLQADASGLEHAVQMQQVAMALLQAQRHGADGSTVRSRLVTRALLDLATEVQSLGLEPSALSLRELADR
ncbi:hypothetical protein KQ304_05225 [Synechococcus sp. CS-1329]|uniref:hypothetical protein n=1 Tax=Synechococcus sp. CS-1329 TaxID=2847975 RepID=UPI00223A92E0|nr:hypothetical protein [Synechococcus sp. CS-1329]MCT0218408.1 hypothetical protein [Synechococcus sp. CS-1329]